VHKRLALILILVVVVPIGAVTWLGMRVDVEQRQVRRQQQQARLHGRLAETAERIARFVAGRQQQVETAMNLPSLDVEAIRDHLRATPTIGQLFVRNPDGTMAFPPRGRQATEAERSFVLRLRELWNSAALTGPPRDEGGTGGEAAADSGWTTWYWQSGLHLLFWRRDGSGRIVGAEIDRVRLLSDLVGELPATFAGGPAERIALVDARGEILYQWGVHEPAPAELPRAERTLPQPLAAWKLQIFVSPAAFDAALGDGSGGIGLFAGIAALAIALLGLALWLYRDNTRRIRETARRVGFVNQVSHELKTPLTNIRMYAELLERDVDELGPEGRRRLDIIVAESQRLSRLIGNVLTFSRQQRKVLKVRPRPACLDDVVADVLEQFAPSLRQHGVEVRFERGAAERVHLDPDAVGQVIGNLVSNVEKYAAAGGQLDVRTALNEGVATVTIADAGPGVPERQAERIFEPFYRLEDAITEGATGTGIGLALARQLARLHGGDLRLLPGGPGARFELQIHVGTEGETS